MKYLQTMIVLVLSAFMLNAQNVGINATGANPDPSAALDIVSNNNGMLIPRVTLTGTTDATTIVNGNVNSLLVFNTATVSDVTPGYYYWSASDNAWIRLEDQNSVSDDWRLTGNAGTNPAGNFVGTTDAQDLVLRTNNTENMRIANATGFVGIGTAAPTELLEVNGNISSNNGTTKAVLGQGGGTTSFVGNTTAHRFDVITNNTPAITVLANSNVGIGSTAPSHPLTIKPTADVAQLSLEQNNSTAGYDLWCTSTTGDLIFRRSSGAAGTERMRLTAAGRLGVGTSNPSVNFQVVGDDGSANQRVARFTNSASSKTFEIGLNSGTDNFAYITQSGCSGIVLDGGTGMLSANMLIVRNNGRIGVGLASPLYRFEIPNINTFNQGQARANAWVTYSDARIKSNFSDIEDAVQTIMQLQPKRYTQHSSKFEGGQLVLEDPSVETVGFVAQDLYKVLPELVHKPENENEDLWSVEYSKLTPVLVKAMQEQQITIEGQQQKIDKQQELIEKLIEQNKALNQRLIVVEKQSK